MNQIGVVVVGLVTECHAAAAMEQQRGLLDIDPASVHETHMGAVGAVVDEMVFAVFEFDAGMETRDTLATHAQVAVADASDS